MQWSKKTENKNVVVYSIETPSKTKLINFILKNHSTNIGMCGVSFVDPNDEMYGDDYDGVRYFGTPKAELSTIKSRLDLAKKSIPKTAIIESYFVEIIIKK